MNFIFKSIIDFILPARCPLSGEIVDIQGTVSPEYWKKLHFISAPYCEKCGLPFEFAPPEDKALLCGQCLNKEGEFEKLRCALVYDDVSKDLVLAYKHGDQTHLAVSMLPWLVQAGGELLSRADYVLPVPLNPMRLLKRRYNQSALLANALAKRAGKPCIPDALRRIRATPPQGHKSAAERRENVKNAFQINPAFADYVRGRHALLVDDVYTTGATIEACAKMLKKAGASGVDVLCLARVVRPDRVA